MVLRRVRVAVARTDLRVVTMTSAAARHRAVMKVTLDPRPAVKMVLDRRRVRVAVARMALRVATTTSAAARHLSVADPTGLKAAARTIVAVPRATVADRPAHHRAVRVLPMTTHSPLPVSCYSKGRESQSPTTLAPFFCAVGKT